MKILIGIVTYDGKKYIIDRFIDSIKKLNYPGEYDILFIDNSKTEDYANYIRDKGFKVLKSNPNIASPHKRLTEAYNCLREWFLEDESYTHLLSIEQDILVPGDTIQRLVNHKKQITSGLYYLGSKPCLMTGEVVETPLDKLREFRFERFHYRYDFIDKDKLKKAQEEKDLIKAYCAGLGCMLIEKSVLEELSFRIIHNGNLYKGHNDMYFSMDCRNRGFEIFVDPTIVCEHDNINYRNY